MNPIFIAVSPRSFNDAEKKRLLGLKAQYGTLTIFVRLTDAHSDNWTFTPGKEIELKRVAIVDWAHENGVESIVEPIPVIVAWDVLRQQPLPTSWAKKFRAMEAQVDTIEFKRGPYLHTKTRSNDIPIRKEYGSTHTDCTSPFEEDAT